jgi:hypothetical protein
MSAGWSASSTERCDRPPVAVEGLEHDADGLAVLLLGQERYEEPDEAEELDEPKTKKPWSTLTPTTA